MVTVVQSFGCNPLLRIGLIFFKKKLYLQKVYVFGIGALYMVMVAESFGCRLSPRDWSNLFQKEIIFAKSICF